MFWGEKEKKLAKGEFTQIRGEQVVRGLGKTGHSAVTSTRGSWTHRTQHRLQNLELHKHSSESLTSSHKPNKVHRERSL